MFIYLFIFILHFSKIIWLTSLSDLARPAQCPLDPSSSIPTVTEGKISFPSAAESTFYCVHAPLLFPSPADGHLGCFHILALADNAAGDIRVYVSFSLAFWVSSDQDPEAELLGPSLSLVIAVVLVSVQSGRSVATPDFVGLFACLHLHEMPFSIPFVL